MYAESKSMEGLKFEMSAVCADRVLSPRAERMKNCVRALFSVTNDDKAKNKKIATMIAESHSFIGVMMMYYDDDDVCWTCGRRFDRSSLSPPCPSQHADIL